MGSGLTGGRITSGLLKFKKVQRGQFEAGFQCAVAMIRRIEEEAEKTKALTAYTLTDETGDMHRREKFMTGMELEIIFKGFGQGREALFQALMTSQGDVVRPLITRLTDQTPIKIGGTRSKKARRL